MKRFLDFYADWCPPCKAMIPTIKELEKEFTDVEFIEINVDDESEKAKSYGVMSIPTYVIEEDDKEITRLTGVQQKSIIEKLLRE